MRRINNQARQRRRQTWLDLPAHGIEKASYGEEQRGTFSESRSEKEEPGEEEIRLHCLPGTRQALTELMTWSGIEEQGEAITLMIHHLHALGPQKSTPLLTPPRHVYEIPQTYRWLFIEKAC